MPKTKKVTITKQKLVTILNKPLTKPRGLASVCNKIGQKFGIVKVLGVSENVYKDTGDSITSLNMTIQNKGTLTVHPVIVSQRYIKELLKDPAYSDKTLQDFDLSCLAELCFEVVELRSYGANVYPELRFYAKPDSEKRSNVVKKKKQVKASKPPPVISDSDGEELEIEDEDEDVSDGEGSND